MINVIQTLKNLNKEFPRFQLETLLKIVECIQDDPIINYPETWKDWSIDPWKNYQVTCDNPTFVYNTTTKNHAVDKTSSHQNIISTGEDASDEDMSFSSTIDSLEDLKKVITATYGQYLKD